jgi:DNA invertase Pin-like site-specific DNA recombinase
MTWWQVSTNETTTAYAVAYYRHSAQDRQKNSVEIQSDQVRAWARDHHVTLIAEFADRGRSGLTAEGRPAFTEMMEWVRTRQDFTQILVLDVSRWGRFQDIDLSAQYSAECKRHGKEVIYVNLGIENDGSPVYPLVVNFERWRSAQYSRELSDKVFKGCVKVVQQGYRAGGAAPYATHRMMVDEQNAPQKVLEHGEHKSIQNWRVKLVPGEPQQVEVVGEIFHQFADRGLDERQIAGVLNHRGVISPGGRPWSASSVHRILTNRTYAGAAIYNRTSAKLKTPRHRNPRSEWVVAPAAYQPVIPPEVFERVQDRLSERRRHLSEAQIWERLKILHAQYGFLTQALIEADSELPCFATVARHCDGMAGTLYRLYAAVQAKARAAVEQEISGLGGKVEAHQDFLVINDRFTVLIQPAVPALGYGTPSWLFRPDHRPAVDLTLGVPLADEHGSEILGYLAMPRLLMPTGWLRLSSANTGLITLHGYQGLHFLKELIG